MIFAGGTAAAALPHSIVTCGGKLHVAMTILLCMVTHSHWRETWPTEHDMTMDPYSYASSHSNRATFMDGILSTPCSSFCFNWCFSHISSLFTSIPPMAQITFYHCLGPSICYLRIRCWFAWFWKGCFIVYPFFDICTWINSSVLIRSI